MKIKPFFLLSLVAAAPLSEGEKLEFSRLKISNWHIRCLIHPTLSNHLQLTYPTIQGVLVGTRELCEQSLKMHTWYTTGWHGEEKYTDCECIEGALSRDLKLPCPYMLNF